MFDLAHLIGKYPGLKESYNTLQDKRVELHDMLEASKNKDGEIDLSNITLEQLRGRNDELNTLKDAYDAKLQEAQAMEHAAEAGNTVQPYSGLPGAAQPLSIGEAFVKSEAFTGYHPGSGIGPVGQIDYPVVKNTLFQTSAGWAPESLRTGRVEMTPTRPIAVMDVWPQSPTGMAAVKYMEETTFTNAAAEAAEAGAYAEAALALTERSVTVQKVAVWLPVTDEQFEDESEAQSYVNNRLPFMLRQRIDSQLLKGNGTPPNVLGTENVSGIQTQALGTDPLFDAAYKLFRKIRDNGFAEPSVFFVAPAAFEAARLARSADGIYILGNPADAGVTRLWGVPGIETTAGTSTVLTAGDYANFSELRVRRDINVQVTNSHASLFISGQLAIRADVRIAPIHYRPKAFGTVTGL